MGRFIGIIDLFKKIKILTLQQKKKTKIIDLILVEIREIGGDQGRGNKGKE